MKPLPAVAVLLSAATFALIVLGGVVHTTGASLACPDWPTCGGQLFPEMVGGVLFEHAHRVLALGVGMAALTLVVWVHVSRATGVTLRRRGLALLCLLTIQVTLGVLTVRFRLPPPVSTAHLATAMLLFVTSLSISHRLIRPPRVSTCRSTVRLWSTVAAVVALFQIVSGAVVRHSGAALVCSGFPVCDGAALWPDLSQPLQQLQMLHRLGALAVIVAVCALFTQLLWDPGTRRAELLLAAGTATLVPIQALIGAWSVTSQLGLLAVTLHLAVGTLLLAALVVLRLEIGSTHPEPSRARIVHFPVRARTPEQQAHRDRRGYE